LFAVLTAGGYNAAWTPPNTIMETIILPKLMTKVPTNNQTSTLRTSGFLSVVQSRLGDFSSIE